MRTMAKAIMGLAILIVVMTVAMPCSSAGARGAMIEPIANILSISTENMHTLAAYPTACVEPMHKKDVFAPIITKEAAPYFINNDKTYEQCMEEAFDRIYKEANRLFDQISNQA